MHLPWVDQFGLQILETTSFTGQKYTEGGSTCTASLGRTCLVNISGPSRTLKQTDSSFLTNFAGETIAAAATASSAMLKTIPANAGNVL